MASRFQITSEEEQKFSFTGSCKVLEQSLDKLFSAVSDSTSGSRNFVVSAYKNRLFLAAFNPDTYAYIEVPFEVQGSGAFGVDPTVLKGILKGRSEMTFSYTGSDCNFKLLRGKYNGKFVVLPLTSEQIAAFNNVVKSSSDEQDAVLSRVVLDAVKEGLLLTSVKDVYANEPLLSYMNMDRGVLTVSCSDQFHIGFYKAKIKDKAKFRIALPSSHFQIIDKLIEGEQAKFYIRDQHIKVEGDSFVLVLPATQADDARYTQVVDYISALETPSFSCNCDIQKLQVLTSNLMTLHTANTKFEFSTKAGTPTLNMVFSTTNGSASDTLKVEVTKPSTLKAPVEPKMFVDALSLVKGKTVHLSFKRNKWLSFVSDTPSGANVTIVCSLGG